MKLIYHVLCLLLLGLFGCYISLCKITRFHHDIGCQQIGGQAVKKSICNSHYPFSDKIGNINNIHITYKVPNLFRAGTTKLVYKKRKTKQGTTYDVMICYNI